MFNALKYTEELEKVGFTREQADLGMKLLVEIMNDQFATKADLKELGWQVQGEVQGLSSEFQGLRSEFQILKSEFQVLRSEVKEMEYKLTIKLGTMMALSVGVTATLVRLLQGPIH